MKPQKMSDTESIVTHLGAVIHLLRGHLHKESRESRLTGRQVYLLQVLFEGGAVSLRELADRVEISHSTASGLIDRLADRGLVARGADPQDRRVTLISLTKNGAVYLQQLDRTWPNSSLDRALARATLGQRRQVLIGLETLYRVLKDSPDGLPALEFYRKIGHRWKRQEPSWPLAPQSAGIDFSAPPNAGGGSFG